MPHSNMMHLLMQAADAVVGRPGTGTTSEAIISGCPMIFNAVGGFMPQEWITMRYAQRHGLAETVYRVEQLPSILGAWRAEPEKLAALRQRMIDCRPLSHPTNVLRLVGDCAATLPPEPETRGGVRAVCATGRRLRGPPDDPAPEIPARSRQVGTSICLPFPRSQAPAWECPCLRSSGFVWKTLAGEAGASKTSAFQEG